MKFDNFKIKEGKFYDGTQKLYRFPNNFGASVVCHSGSYGGRHGLFELATIYWSRNNYELVNCEIEGWLSFDQVAFYLERIKKYGTIHPQKIEYGDKGGLDYAA